MTNKRKKGFTLVELMVVLVILGIIAAIAVPLFINYWKKAEFRKNEENAKTVYLAAESRLTYYRSSGQWEQFKKEIQDAVKDTDSEIAQKAVFKDNKDSRLNGRIYTIKLNKSAADQTKENNLVLRLLDDYTYDKGFLDASISIEIDIESGEVYSAFYGSRCKGLNYKADDVDGYLTMQKRDYDSRSKRLLGYYSTEDTVNTVNLETKRLRITTINLVNSEKLSLDWSSNVGADFGVDYEVSFYKNDDNTKLFTLRVSPFDMGQQGWSTNADSTAGMATLELTKADGTKDTSNWMFPVTYSDNKYSVVLDAMMSAKVQAALDGQTNESAKSELEKTSSTSITRLATIITALSEPQNIYAKVKATAYTGSSNINISQEYRDSEQVSSNVANTMFGDNTKGSDIQVAAFRHLSNMRYYEKNHDSATFTLTNKNMDWASVGTGLYDFKAEAQPDGTKVEKLAWRENTKTETVGFPSIKELPKEYTLTGKGSQTLVSNLHLDEESVADDTTTTNLNVSRSEFLGLFCELKGTVKDVVFRDPTLMIGQKGENDSAGNCKSLKGVGILAGRSEGKLTEIAVTRTKQNSNTVETNVKVDVLNANVSDNKDTLGVGMLVGVLAKYENGTIQTLSSGTVSNLTIEGKLEAVLPSSVKQTDAYGIGGIIGYANLNNKNGTIQINGCMNDADVSGNVNTGGIVGRLDGTFRYNNGTKYTTSKLKQKADILNCNDNGLILCDNISTQKAGSTIEGNYFGGIVGYSNQALVYNAVSALGRSGSFRYSSDNQKELLQGRYVGGIAGYGEHTLLSNCSTEKNGYVLGDEYVGGIAGGLGGGVPNAIQASTESGASVTANASYVIGNGYVGGIVGENATNVTLKNCINQGVAAGYKRYVGGIVGYNQADSTIADCASYLSDYDNSVYNRIVHKWKATASFAGGIAGYNDGAITFSDESEAITVKSVSSIVVGQNYVGGIAGFNDENATIDVHYTLIGGRIYAYGKCAGGAFGLNASAKVLNQELTIKPQSIQGQYFVGGVIGANVVNLTQDMTMNQMRTDNILGRITGEAFCGGIVGYQRTYAASQLGTAELKNVALEILPGLDSNGVPAYPKNTLAVSQNPNQLTITTTNNIPIRAGLYAGGIVGYCEKDSHLLLKNCTNSGDIAQTASVWKNGVVLGSYIESNEIGRTKSELPSGTDGVDSVRMHFAGGILSVNLENQIIDSCFNTGNMSGYAGTGGVVGLNAGLVYQCQLQQHFGNAALNYIGGIAGINVGAKNQTEKSYSSGSNVVQYTAGTIQNCTTAQNKTVSGSSNVGGLVGWNLNDGVLTKNTSNANISASGKENAGGIAGRNNGNIIIENSRSVITRSVSAGNATGVGGLAGMNEANGTIRVTGDGETSGEIIAVDAGLSVSGSSKVGGIVGINHGVVGEDGTTALPKHLVCKAKNVRASHGFAGGIAGETNGNVICAVNRSAEVIAYEGTAGGITAVNTKGKMIQNCTNYGKVTSNHGHASGIAAENDGMIKDCTVKSSKSTETTEIYSRGGNEIGAITSLNKENGIVENSKTERNVVLSGDASIIGGLVGDNEGTVRMVDSSIIPKVDSSKSNLTVGGVVGENRENANVTGIQVKVGVTTDSSALIGFKDYQYLGGIVGQNSGTVSDAAFSGTIEEKNGSAGNCYGGIAGINMSGAELKNCSVGKITMTINGVYTATSTSTAAQKEALATHAGGIVGKNEENAVIDGCTLENNADSKLTAKYGMLGGVAGFNKGKITMSGSSITPDVMNGADTTDELAANAIGQGLSADGTYVNTRSASTIENMKYNGGTTLSAGKLEMYMLHNGNIGGITAYNGTAGQLSECVSGKWFLNNKSEAIGVGTGGIIGMNESQKDLSKLVNGAFVGRQIGSGDTNRFAGGIIGNQNNATGSDWLIEKCINYGTIYCYNSHYSGGIMGQWTGTGGTIQNCRNYGNLQTTFAANWVGASGGIVAQLYHANENNEYNIISCENYGSIYKSAGSGGSGANDSAGILGNITTYQVSNVSNANRFTVRILDCMNGPGVSIYSNSMASGIFGFLSCDNANSNSIIKSTPNVKMQIERCRNYARHLIGNSFVGGIFGARYDGWSNNTIVNDCYSPSFGNRDYNKTGNPIYSNGIVRGSQNPTFMSAENRKNNFFYDGIGERTNRKQDGYLGADFTIGVKTIEGTIIKGSDRSQNIVRVSDNKLSFGKIIENTQIMRKADDGAYVVTQIYSGVNSINGANCYIDQDGYIKDGSGTRIGQVLYYVGNEQYPNHDNIYDIGATITDPSKNLLAYNSRESYCRLEGVEREKNELLAPAFAEAKVETGKITVKVVPQTMDHARNGSELYDSTTACDPFMYEVRVTNGTNEKIYKIYSENESFSISKEITGKVKISVRVVSMFDDVEPSKWYDLPEQSINKVLPDPDVKIELISKQNADNNHVYRFVLNNLDEYNATDENGNAIYPNWQVKIKVAGIGNLTLNASNPTGTMKVAHREDGAYTYQMTAQASTTGGTTMAESSKEISTATQLPGYRPPITLKEWNPQLVQNVTVTGTTLDDLSVKVELDAKNQKMNTPPIYRAELIGTWNGEENVVFAKEDILTVSAGKASATFTNLPEYIGQARNLRVRIWYASSGLGPVYTYYDVDASQITEANVKELTDVDENGTAQWTYSHSTILENYAGYFTNYQNVTSKLWEWLPAPVLEGADLDTYLEPVIGINGEMLYTFTWDSDIAGTSSSEYQVSMTGVDVSGREVKIDLGDAYTGGKSLTVDGTDWNYSKIKLKVTRVGKNTSAVKQIGLATTGTYNVKQRLEQSSQLTAENPDTNELIYRLSWSQITSEEGCNGYQAYIRVYDDKEKLGEEKELGTQVTTAQNASGTYSEDVDLEAYAGKRVVIYLKAKAAADSAYLDSVAGITNELEIPTRLPKPKVTWQTNWTHHADNYIAAEAFTNGGMTVTLTPNDNASVPPGGSAYLLKAYVYDSAAKAKAATQTDPGDYVQAYPIEGSVAQMEVADHKYSHDMQGLSIQYAGKWIVFYARISSGGGNISSEWTKSDSYRLPYVKLQSPQVESNEADTELTANVSTTPEVAGEDKVWTAKQTVLSWNSVECADIFTLNLNGTIQDASAQGGKTQLDKKVRMIETADGVQVQVYRLVEVQKEINGEIRTVEEWQWVTIDENDTASQYPEGTPETEIHHEFDITDYSVKITSAYKAENGSTPTYELTLSTKLDVVKNADGTYSYTLKLPDVSDVKAEDGNVEHTNFHISNSMVFKANVTENIEEDQILQKSEAYVESDETKVEWKNN